MSPKLDQESADLQGPNHAPLSFHRRQFLSLGGLSLGLGSTALSGCTRAPSEKIVPYRIQPEDVVPGRPTHYASAFTIDGFATGILLECHDGRPTKVEGNPDHPASLGATTIHEQALIAELYHPGRQRALRHRNQLVSDGALERALAQAGARERRGRGLHLVLPPQSSPTLGHLLDRLREQLPQASVHFHTPFARTAAWQGARMVFGEPLEPRVDLTRARVVVSLDADLLGSGPAQLTLTRAFSDARRVSTPQSAMNRLYVIEPTPSVTGNLADHRLALEATQIPQFSAALLRQVARELAGTLPLIPGNDEALAPRISAFVRALSRDLSTHRGASVVLAGERQPPLVHAIAHALNDALGNAGTTIEYARSPIIAAGGPEHDSTEALRAALVAGEVETLLLFDVNLAHTAPGALGLASVLRGVPRSFYCGLFENATSAICEWTIPRPHPLESWADTRAFEGTSSIIQPAIAPLYDGFTEAQILAALIGQPRASAHELVREFCRTERQLDDEAWDRALSAGVIADSAISPARTAPLRWDWLGQIAELHAPQGSLELHLQPDPRLHDGRFVDNPWLLELPCPITKQTWGNAARISPEFAAELGIGSGDVLTLHVAGRALDVPALIVPGQAERAVTLTLGWGQTGPSLGANHGANGYSLMIRADSWTLPVTVTRTARHEALALTQLELHAGAAADAIFAIATLEDYRSHGSVAEKQRKKQLSMYEPDAARAPRQWGMTIDLNACTGCSACVIACQSENSIPTVGKSGVLKHREMHWLRIDRYVVGSPENQRTISQPMACQHCEHAPCEYVCPTAATVHSSDGLNQMIYNRCVGTRFCSNNCPYKVRRFNWFNYHADEREPTELGYNPEVSVRARGVMEKCSYCVQRIRKAEILARTEEKPLLDGAVRTACEQVCPAGAIVFGDIADAHSRAAQLAKSDRAFAALNELGTVPRTRYLAKLTNPNPELT